MCKYFKNIKTLEELKIQYKALAKKYHPDLNENSQDSVETMKIINNEYEKMFNLYKNKRKNASGEIYDYSNVTEQSADFINIINTLINCEGVVIEIIGSWIWLSGETKPHKDIIKNLGFKWAAKKKLWAWNDGKTYSRSNKSIDDIRQTYGSTIVNGQKDKWQAIPA